MQSQSFIRRLGKLDVIMLSFGAMIGWSWVAIAGNWIDRGGALGAMIAFALAGIAVILIALTYAELAASMPKAGGEHVYTEKALGRNWSFIVTWAIIFAYVGVSAFEAVAIATVLEYFFPAMRVGYLWSFAGNEVYAGSAAAGMVTTVLITFLNVRGIRPAAIFQFMATLLIITGGAVLITGAGFSGSAANAEPLFNNGLAGIAAVMVMVPAMLVGFDVIPQSAEEINIPFKDIGKMLIISVVCAVIWYLLIIYAVSFSLDTNARAEASLTTAAASKAMWNSQIAGDFLVIAGLGGILTSWNAFVVGGSRAIFALSRSGHLPKRLGTLHADYGTPVNAILLIGVLSFFAPLLGRQAMVWIIDATGLAIVFAYGMVSWSFLKLRRDMPNMDRPYRVPFGNFVGWGAVILSIALATLYLPGSPAALIWPYEWAMLIGWSVIGLVIFRRAETANPS